MHAILRRLLPVLLIFPLAAHGTVVTTKTDEDNGSLGGGTGISLREAVKYSPAGDTITFAAILSGQTIRLTLGEITLANSLTIDGSALPTRITLSGDKTGNGRTTDDTRILNITNGTVLLDSLLLDKGHCPSGTGQHGAAIHANNTSTRLTVRNCAISNNETTTNGGGIYFIGASNNPASFLTIEKCSFTGNKTGHDGGAIHMAGTLQVKDSTFSNNIAYQGSAIFNNAGVATVDSSTFSNSSAYGNGGAIYNQAMFTLRSSTVSGNSAQRGGGICNFSGTLTVETSCISNNSSNTSGGGIFASGILNLLNSTLAGNSANTSGGGLYCNIVTASLNSTTVSGNSTGASNGGIYHNDRSTVMLGNSIVAGNTAPARANLTGTFTGSNNLTSGNPLLAPLGDYGGPTHTMPPLPGSPAINAGGSTTLLTDQRGVARVGAPDIGAVEYQPADFLPLMPYFWALDTDGDGLPYAIERLHGTDPAVPDAASPRLLSAPVLDGQGRAILKFEVVTTAPDLASRPRWSLKRSADLSPGSFQEIYHYGFYGSYAFTYTGASYTREPVGTIDRITVTDTNPPPGGGFYRFEAVFAP